MKPFNYDPLNSNAPKTTTTSRKRMLSEIGQKAINEMLSKASSEEKATVNNKNTANSVASQLTPSFEEIFRPLAATGLLKIINGKVLIKTNTSLETVSSGMILIGVLTIGVTLKTEGINDQTIVTFCLLGGALLVLGTLLKKAFASYSVFDNKLHKIYTECFFFSSSIYKSKPISKNEILQVAVDHRKIEGNVINTANAMREGGKEKHEPVESAVVFLLKNGTLFHFNSFTNWDGADEFYTHVAMSMCAVWDLAFKNSDLNTKFIAKRLRGKLELYPTNMNEIDAGGIISSMLRIVLGVFVAIGSIVLVFWLIFKFI